MGYISQAQGEDKQWSEAKIGKLIKEKNKKIRMFRLSELKESVKKKEVALRRKEQLY